MNRLLPAFLSVALALGASGTVCARSVPGGFAVGQYGTSFTNGTAMAWAPDGRLFVCQQDGAVRGIKGGPLLSTPFRTTTGIETLSGRLCR